MTTTFMYHYCEVCYCAIKCSFCAAHLESYKCMPDIGECKSSIFNQDRTSTYKASLEIFTPKLWSSIFKQDMYQCFVEKHEDCIGHEDFTLPPERPPLVRQ